MSSSSYHSIGFETPTLITFVVVVIVCLAIDLFAHRKDQIMTLKASCLWTCFWILVSVLFGIFLLIHWDREVATLFFTGYILEKSLSVDNLFVIIAVFAWFKIPENYKHRVLYYGILGAIVFRAIFVAIGTSFIYLFGQWVEIIFGLWVFSSALVMIKNSKHDDTIIEDYSRHGAYRATKWLFPIWPKLHGHDFFIGKTTVEQLMQQPENRQLVLKRTGIIFATPLLLCLSVVEISDISFAFDSVPAVIAVSKDPLIIYSSMIFAVLGLRSMYFILEALRKFLCHLETSVIILLFFIAFKLCYNSVVEMCHMPNLAIGNITNLIIIGLILTVGVVSSLIFKEDKTNIENGNN